MNEYCQHKIKDFYESFINRVFDQDDVAQFLIAARDYSRKEGALREIGDFLAHPELKDRGVVLKNINEIMPLMDKLIQDSRLDTFESWKRPTFKGIGTDEELIDDLRSIFQKAGLQAIEISREDKSFRDFLFCSIFLLSNFNIKYKDRKITFEAVYSHSLKLQVRCESDKYKRNYALLPVLKLHNVWTNCPTVLSPSEYSLKKHIARRFKQGFLAAISYEDDAKYKRSDLDSDLFSKGEIWPLP